MLGASRTAMPTHLSDTGTMLLFDSLRDEMNLGAADGAIVRLSANGSWSCRSINITISAASPTRFASSTRKSAILDVIRTASTTR
jgi:hypothetical protein